MPQNRHILPFLLSARLKRLDRYGRHQIMTFRVLGPHERGRFAPEAWGHLLALTGSGSLNAAELEHIIERALIQIDGRIALDDLRSLMEGAGFMDQNDGDQSQTVH
jgi:Smg protein